MTGSVPRTMTVFCDETGAHDCAYFAWGSIWMAHDRVDEFNETIDAIAKKHGLRGEFGWKDTSSRTAFCIEVVRWFFQQRWVCFQSLLVRKRDMRIFTSERLRNDTVAYKKLLCTLVAVQAAGFDALPGGPRQFRIHVDQVGDRPEVAEDEYRIVAAAIRKRTETSLPPVATFARVDSRSARGIQLADLLVGAIRAEWEGGAKTVKREKFRRFIAACLGWENLRATTPKNLKFNIWLHYDCRGFAMRPMELRYPKGDPEASFGASRGFRTSLGLGSSGDRVEASGENGLTVTITRGPAAAKTAGMGKSVGAQATAKVLTKKEMKAADRALAREKKAGSRAWAKRKSESRARAKAKKEKWEAKVQEKEASRKVAKPQKKSKEKTK